MLRSIQKLIGDKRKQLIFPIFLMSLDAIGSLVMYLMLYFTVIHLLNGSLTGGLVRNYTIVCLISVILRLIIYRSAFPEGPKCAAAYAWIWQTITVL